jgi:hypothetical protein
MRRPHSALTGRLLALWPLQFVCAIGTRLRLRGCDGFTVSVINRLPMTAAFAGVTVLRLA